MSIAVPQLCLLPAGFGFDGDKRRQALRGARLGCRSNIYIYSLYSYIIYIYVKYVHNIYI